MIEETMRSTVCHIAMLFFLGIAVSLPAEERPQKNVALPSESYVRPIDLSSLKERFRRLPKRDHALVDLYLEGAQRYVLTPEDGCPPDGVIGRLRNIAERAHGAAVLGTLAPQWPESLKERCRRESVGFLKTFVAEYRKDKNLNYKPPALAPNWQISYLVAEMGVAVWFLWDHIDPSTRRDASEMIAFHADNIAGREPGARVKYDTEAETVAWDSAILALAANMMPTHPHNAKWQRAAKRYVYTIFATSKDLHDTTPGDDGKPIKDWVVGANIHDDFSLENHGRFHMDYVFCCYRFINFGASMYRLAGYPVPKAFSHHTRDVYENIVLPCTDASGFAIYVSDNDWKRYHAWTESPAVHGYNALMESSPLSSALEERSIRNAVSYWREFPEKFKYDTSYVCGKAWTPRIADIVLLHLLSPPSPDPVPQAQVDAQLQGVHQKQDVNLLTQYSREASFRSVYWGPGPTVRHIEPKDNGWMLLPVATDYGVSIDGKTAFNYGADVISRKGVDWFWTLRHHPQGEQDAFVSLPDETVVMFTSATLSGAVVNSAKRVDSVVTTERPHKRFTIYSEGGKATYRYGQEKWDRTDHVEGLDMKTQWVNLSDSMGYVVVNLSPDSSRMILPKPGVRDSLSLYHVENPSHDQHFVTVALPNQSHRQTSKTAGKIRASRSGAVMTCLVSPYFVWANFSDREATVQAPDSMRLAGPVRCPPNSVGILRKEGKDKAWSPLQ